MGSRGIGLLTALAVAAGSGCGDGEDDRVSLERVPLAPDARVLAQAYGCPTTPDVCFRWAIVEAGKEEQRRTLLARDWRQREGVRPTAVAADSPDGETFISFEAGREELVGNARDGSIWGTRRLVRRLRELVRDKRRVLAVTIEPLP